MDATTTGARRVIPYPPTGLTSPEMSEPPLVWALHFEEHYPWFIFPVDRETGIVLDRCEGLPDRGQVQAWWESYPEAVIGLACGEVSQVTAAVWTQDHEQGGNYHMLMGLPTIAYWITHIGRVWLLSYDPHWEGVCQPDGNIWMVGDGGYVLLPPVEASEEERRMRIGGMLDSDPDDRFVEMV